MTVAPVPGPSPTAAGHPRAAHHLPRWVLGLAVGLAAAGGLAVAHAVLMYRFAIAVGGPYAADDNWVGTLIGLVMLGGFLASLAAFVMAVVARARHVRSRLLWVPLSVWPAVVAFLVLGETFWWE